MVTIMTDLELMEATIRLMRDTRLPLVLDVCAEVQRRLAGNLLPRPAPSNRPSRAAYMRAYRIKRRAIDHNPFA